MAKNNEKVIKYTLMPRNEHDDYSKNFQLSLREFAKSLEDKTLVAPLIIYNSDLDIPLDMEEEIEKYCFYADKDNLEAMIKKQEATDVFRCLILHGFDIELDEIRDIYCPISRKNEADICINVIRDLDFEENLTFYLRNDLDKYSDEEWEADKKQIEDDMLDYIDDWMAYDKLSETDMMELLPFLMTGDMDEFDRLMDEKKKKQSKKDKKQDDEKKNDLDNKIIHIPLPTDMNKSEQRLEEVDEEEYESVITCSYEHESLISLSKFDDDFYVIEDDDYEIALNLDQMLFLIESFNRIKDKPVKND